MEKRKLREQYAAWSADLEGLRLTADELNLVGRLELWDRLTAASTFLRGDVLPLLMVESSLHPEEGTASDILRLHDAEIAKLAEEFDDARRALLIGEPHAKTALRHTLYALHGLLSLRAVVAETVLHAPVG